MTVSWLIVSFEHNAFWGPHECGYTREIAKAGRYSINRAHEIVLRANIAQPHDDPHEVMVPCPSSVATLLETLATKDRLIAELRQQK